jgi:hypothetical protein
MTAIDEMLANPAFQSGIIPFGAALIAGLILNRLGWYWSGLALMVGFIATVYLTAGFQFQPWTSTRKILALGFAAAGLGILLDLYPWGRRWLPAFLFSIGAAAVLWVIWPVLQRREGLDGWLLGVSSVLYSGWCVASMESLRSKPTHATSAVIALGFGTGAVTLLGASALLGQLGLALGAAAGALGLLVSFARKVEVGSTALLPAGLLLGLIGISGHVYAKVPWYSLAMLALVTVCARVPLSTQWPRWLQALTALLLAGAPAGIAAWLVWRVAGGVPL